MGSCTSKKAISTASLQGKPADRRLVSDEEVVREENVVVPETIEPLTQSKPPSPDFLDMTPVNTNVTNYCKGLINVDFHGCDKTECKKEKKRGLILENCDRSDSPDTPEPGEPPDKWAKLAAALKSMDAFLRNNAGELKGDEEEYMSNLQGLVEARCKCSGTDAVFGDKFRKDAQHFVKIYNKRGGVSEEMDHDEYWADRQQLLSGKVIADHIDEEYGPMDPVFGVMLSPVAGRIGPSDSHLVHHLLFDGAGCWSYHGAVHDAFGYLLTAHGVGPGYGYTGGWSAVETDSPMSGQLSGLDFWGKTLEELEYATPARVI